jgi:hypothetical protein
MGAYLILQVGSFSSTSRWTPQRNDVLKGETHVLTVRQQVNIPLQVQPQIFGFFSLVGWGQILYYNQLVKLDGIRSRTSILTDVLQTVIMVARKQY